MSAHRAPAGAAARAHAPASVDALAAIIRDACAHGRALRIVSRGTWLAAGAPVRAGAERVALAGITGIVDYVPGDLTLTARAGTTIAEVDAATAPHGQWCPLLPWGGDDGSLGATFATATSGPCAHALGAPRDVALGLEFVDGTGAIARAGGRVVKNVAGFDLTRLLVGSWGTLGVITEISVRLRAKPPVDESWALALDPADRDAPSRLGALRSGPLAPLAAELLTPEVARALGLAESRNALVRLGGNASFVAAARAAVRALGGAEPCDPAIWSRLRALDPRPRAWTNGNALADPLTQRVKAQFDPAHILNPGIFGEGTA